MRLRLAFLVCMYLTIVLNNIAQVNYFKLNGTVVNLKTKEPLAYASIGVKGQSIGTVSNMAGEFEFFIPGNLLNDSLFISYIGYQTITKKISSLNKSDGNFLLKEISTLLNEVVISSVELSAKEIIEKAASAIVVVFPSQSYIMEGFHRSWEKIEFTDSITYPGTLIESAVSIYDPGYGHQKGGNKLKEEIYINEVRRSNLMEGWNYNGNWLAKILRENIVKYNRARLWVVLKSFLDLPNDLVYELEGSTRVDDEDIYIVKVAIPNSRDVPAFYKIYISQKDFSILRYELHGGKLDDDFTREWNLKDIEQIYIFKRYLNSVCLSYAKIQYKVNKVDMVKMKVLQSEDYFMELLINNIITENVPEKRKSMGRSSKNLSLALQAKTYNEEFWANYNIIKENPLDREMVGWFEKEGKLEEQYKKLKTQKNKE